MTSFKTDRELLAYLAGAMDSDGSICIVRKKPKNKSRIWPYYMPSVRIGQIHDGICRLMKSRFGGSIHIRIEKKKRFPSGRFLNPKPMFIWGAQCGKAEEVAIALLPFLRIKKKQARLVMKARGLAIRSAKFYHRRRKIYEERGRAMMHKALNDCWLEMGDLNMKSKR